MKLKSIFAQNFLTFILFLSIFLFGNNIYAKEIFIDVKSSSGTEDGSFANPFHSIAQATAIAVSGDVVTFRAGVYREEVLIPADKITFQGYQNEVVTINGAEIVTAWTKVGTSPVYRSLMKWNVDSINGRNQIFVDQKMINLARWPNQTSTDIIKPTDAIAESVTASGNSAIIIDNEFNEPDGRWLGAQIWINLSHNGVDGQGWTGIITATNQASHSITIDFRSKPVIGDAPWGLGKNTEYYLFNPTPAAVKASGGVEALLSAGEWWKNADTLYVSCPNGNAPGEIAANQNVVESKKRQYAFSSSDMQVNRSFTTIRNFSLFAATITTDNNADLRRGDLVEDAHDILIEGIKGKYLSHFTNQSGDFQAQWTGRCGIILSGVSNTLRNSTLQYAAGSAVSILGYGSKLLNCSILDANYSCSNSGAVNSGYDLKDGEIAYNTISNTPIMSINSKSMQNSNLKYRAISRIHHNVVKDFMRRSYDSGAIDMVGKDGQWTRIDHNQINNSSPADAQPTARYGVYLDFGGGVNGDEGRYIVDHNVIYNVNTAIQLNHIKDVAIYNNVGIIAGANAILNGNGGTGTGDTIRNNILSTPPNTTCCSWGVLKDAVIENNIENAVGAVLTDIFVDAANYNFQLKPTASLAIDKGFDFSPYNDPLTGGVDLGAFEYGKTAWTAGVGAANLMPPVILPNGGYYQSSKEIFIQNSGANGMIRYTLDGTDPVGTSPEYVGPFTVTDTTIVKVRTFISANEFSEVSAANFYIEKMPDLPLLPAVNPTNISQGINLEYYQWAAVNDYQRLQDLETWIPVETKVVNTIDLGTYGGDFFALKFTGYIDIPADGIYTFYTKSDDNSKLYIDNNLVVSNDFCQPPTERIGRIGLKAGKHSIKAEYQENSGGEALSVSYKGPITSKRFLPANGLWHNTYIAQTAKVSISPNGGKFIGSVIVNMTCATPNSLIYYTIDGSIPTTASTLYTQALTLTTNVTYKAIAYCATMANPLSNINTAVFVPSAERVKISPKGGTFMESASVTLSTITPGASIVYTLNGSNPTTNSTLYSGAIKIDASALLKTMAFKSGLSESYVDSAAYIIKVSSPVFTPISATFSNTLMVSISCITPGSSIYYAINGTPTTSSPLYTAPFEINSSCFIKAMAVKAGLTSSPAIKKAYTLVTGIDDITFSNLNVYPNPSSDGSFSLKLPETNQNEKIVLQIANYLGQIIYTETITAGASGNYKCSNQLNKGYYLLLLKSNSTHETAKLIVK